MCWEVPLLPIKVADTAHPGADVGRVAKAIDLAVEKDARVIVLSFGRVAYSGLVREAIRKAGDKGVVVVVAAGNSGKDLDKNPVYPACFNLPNIITVMATTSSDKRWGSSNFGQPDNRRPLHLTRWSGCSGVRRNQCDDPQSERRSPDR